jgi:rRNA maturation endonuclease Nob1
MYHGIVTRYEITYHDKYMSTLNRTVVVPQGTQAVQRHTYTCDTCGRRFHFPAQATEAFYCPTCPGQEVSITLAQEA